ncbi:MAG: hypothetical protein QOE22_316 [Candidatus Parcubacteria bacterium]|nr:hypothetical protein [Candidatus Parcubacteria bacterium]
MSVTLSLALLLVGNVAHGATSPSLGLADTFGILSSTYTNTVPGTTINGDLGYTTGPAMAPTVNGTTYTPGPTHAQAGVDQAAALAALNSELCTFTFPAGAVDLAANAQFPTATYGPGVYCITGAASVGTGGITLTGAGTYIFRMTGALDSVAASVVTLGPGASECDIWWTPTGATTLGANSTFRGTVIDAAAITVGSTVTWVGRALGFGGTVTTAIDTITVPSCAAPSATLTVTKSVVNDDGGTMEISDFPLFIGASSVTSGVATTTLAPGTYTVSETDDAGYAASVWGGDCAADGSITLADGDDVECTITNDDIAGSPPPSAALTVTKTVVNDDGGALLVSDFPLFIDAFPTVSGIATTTLSPGTYTMSETGNADYDAGDWGGDCATDGTITLADGDNLECTITNDDVDATVSGGSSSGGGNGGSSNRRRSEPVASGTETSSSPAATDAPVSVNGVPGLPNAGLGPDRTVPCAAASVGVLGCALAAWTLRRRNGVTVIDAV